MKMPRVNRVFLLTLLALSLFLAAASFLLTSSWPLEKFLTYKIEHDLPFVEVQSLNIAEQALGSKGSFSLSNITGSFLMNGQKIDVGVDEIRIIDLRKLFEAGKDTHFLIYGAHVSREDISISNAKADLKYRGVKEKWQLKGDVAVEKVNASGQSFHEVIFKLDANERELSIMAAHLKLLEGSVQGDLILSMDELRSYDLTMELNGVPAKYIAVENFSLESQLRGLINGRLAMSGDTERIALIDAQLDAPNGMYVNAQLLGFLLNYIPQSTQKQQIEKLIKEGKNIYIDKFKLDIMNDNSDLMKTSFALKSIEYNLDVNLGVDINVEGGLMALLKQGLNYIPKEKK